MKGSIILFEDAHVDQMWPIALTRPAFAVTCAAYNLYEVAALAVDQVSYVIRDYLKKTTARQFPSSATDEGPALFLNASVVPDVRYVERLRELTARGEPFVCTCGERLTAAMLPRGVRPAHSLGPADVTPYLLGLGLPVCDDEPFKTFDYPFHAVGAMADLFPANIRSRIERGSYREVQPGVFVGDGVSIAGTAVFHAEEGPIVLDSGVRVLDFSYLHGPLYVGPRSRIIERSSVKEFTSIRHTCKIGGEVEASIIEPYTNKQHHGFLGHAYVGSWVNLGAGTSNSDLKNTYGLVRVELGDRRVETGMQFLGCIIGDYAKSAINTSIFTGKIIGAASMLYGYVGQNVPSFTNYAKSFGQVTECSLEQAIVTQKRMFMRRDVQQSEEDIELLRAVFELTREERRISGEPPVI